jgi:hypothetical protein
MRYDAATAKSVGLRWIVRPVAFVVPLAGVAGWSEILPGWKMAALLAFCMFWADAVGLLAKTRGDEPAPAVPRHRRFARPWPRWDFEDYEAVVVSFARFAGRAISFIWPVVLMAWWTGAPLGWRLAVLVAFCVVWDKLTDRIGAQD